MPSRSKKGYVGTRSLPDDFIVFDIETTGLNSSTHEIIEVGAIKFLNNQRESSFHSYIKPSTSIPKSITELTGISNDSVKDAPNIVSILNPFLEFIDRHTLVIHNAPFDMGFLIHNLKEYNISFKDFIVVDTKAF